MILSMMMTNGRLPPQHHNVEEWHGRKRRHGRPFYSYLVISEPCGVGKNAYEGQLGIGNRTHQHSFVKVSLGGKKAMFAAARAISPNAGIIDLAS